MLTNHSVKIFNRKNLFKILSFVLIFCGLIGLASNGVFADISNKTADGTATVDRHGWDNFYYGEETSAGSSSNWYVTRNGEEITAFCGQSKLRNPDMTEHTAYRINRSAESEGTMNVIRYLLVAYKKHPAFFDTLVGPGLASTRYTAVHAAVSQTYSGSVAASQHPDVNNGKGPATLYNKAVQFNDMVRQKIESDDGYFVYTQDGETKSVSLNRYVLYAVVQGGDHQDLFWIEEQDTANALVKKVDVDSENISQGDASIVGAKFNVSGAGVNKNLTVGSDGKTGTVQNLIIGEEYIFKETDVPDGYKKMSNVTETFTVSDANKTKTLNFTNEIIRGDVKIKKCDSDSSQAGDDGSIAKCIQGDANLEGIQFRIWNASDAAVWVDPSGTDRKANRAKCNSISSSRISSRDEIDTSKLTASNACATITTNANGNGGTSGAALPYGTYVIREVRSNDGYHLSDGEPRWFRIRADQGLAEFIDKPDATHDYYANTSDNTGDMFIDDAIRGDVQLQKCDENEGITGVCAEGDKTLADVEFEILNKSANPVAVNKNGVDAGKESRSSCPNDGSTVCATIKTDENGVAKTTGKALPYGTYLIREKVGGVPATTGMRYTQNEFTFEIRNDGQVVTKDKNNNAIKAVNLDQAGDVEIQKCDSDHAIVNGTCQTNGSPQGDTKLAGISFQIINKSQKTDSI